MRIPYEKCVLCQLLDQSFGCRNSKKKPPNNQEKRGYRFVTTEVDVY